MKISVILPSRNRPAGLLSVLKAFDAMASGQNDVKYIALLDDDDYVTLEQVAHWEKSGMLPEGVNVMVEGRTRLVNARFNTAVATYPADIYSQACDDSYPLCQHWDTLFAGARDLPAFGWKESNDPGNCTYPVVSERWRAAVGRFYPEYFPFWFADTWIGEVFNLAFAKPIPIINQLALGGKRGHTQGMRDLAFWFKFYAETRVERIAEAEQLARAYGFSLNCRMERVEQLAALEQGDAYQMGRVPIYEAAFKANVGEPNERYLRAKAVAAAWMDEHIVEHPLAGLVAA